MIHMQSPSYHHQGFRPNCQQVFERCRDCLVSPDVFKQMVDRLGEFIMPYQQALETEADPHSMHLYLQGLLSHLPRKNAEAIAA